MRKNSTCIKGKTVACGNSSYPSIREGNRYADAMAKHGSNHEEPLRNWHLPLEGLSELLAANVAGAVFVGW